MEEIKRVQAELGGLPLDDQGVAEALDKADSLARFRDAFALPPGSIYLCGHSLGPMPRATPHHIEQVLTKWSHEAVLGWFQGPSPFKDAEKGVLLDDLAALVGASSATEVVAMSALTVNLHLMLAAFYRPTEGRYKIIVEEGAFPSDMHAIRSHLAVVHPNLAARDHVVLLLPRRPDEATWRPSDVLEFVQEHGSETALVFLSGVHYATGQLFDMAAITRTAHERGCMVGFDLAHAIGNVELQLHEWGVDFGIWCHYKYLSAGPGAVGGCFVHAKHTPEGTECPARFAGWWGQNEQDRFSFAEPSFRPAPGALGFQLSTPSPMQLAALGASLALFRDAGMASIRAKSVRLTAYLEALITTTLPSDQVQIVTSLDPTQRGCQLSLTFKAKLDAGAVLQGLQARGVIADVRKPNFIRVAPFPLYTSFSDVLRFVHVLKEVLRDYDG